MRVSTVPMGMSQVTFYAREDCPYSQKVRSKLDALDVAYEETLVPDAHTDRTTVEDVTGQTGVPVVIDDHMEPSFLADTQEIITHLETQYA
ncbi:glutaredoxin [Halobacterium salinarum]|nr:glutaredoxin [Halobacterium salinarum]QRY23463.1 glutaredoxin [Halobacterium sp. GSL-19]MCF2168726.1 glutaredoxin [Halobacterium salinarum]MCF2206604.1 glutaredoxin [Halobacterium salinarum]MCF2238118.1 glutaredoxin [Halobacterium salinarum]